MKKVITFSLFINYICLFSQVGINTTQPQAVFHIDGLKDNVPETAPTLPQQSNDFVVKADGKVGVGTVNPQVNLEMVAKNPTGTVTTPDGMVIPKVSLSRMQQMDDNANLQYGNLVYADNIDVVRDGNTNYVVFPGFYFWNGTYWAKLLTFNQDYGVDVVSNIYTGTTANNTKTTKCGRFIFNLTNASSPYPQIRLAQNPNQNVTIKVAFQDEYATDTKLFYNNSISFTSANYSTPQNFNTNFLGDRNILTAYITYPGGFNVYRVEFFKANNVWSIVCTRF